MARTSKKTTAAERPVQLHEITQSRYLNYALSVITSRALPDVRDGLKPVQRRILYAMYHDLKLKSDARFLKSARVVGDVMGKYHPHGDQSIYDAMVRMSQPFSLRYPLVDGHGNFGSLDGDSAAAMRYTEARLAAMAEELLTELSLGTVDERDNYDGQLQEPQVLPAQLPNLLLNGATGIAVGMATNIPPHNLRELIKALTRIIRARKKGQSVETAALCADITGPDFPTGGELLNTPEELIKIYEKGQGAFVLRGTWRSEEVNGRPCVIIDSVPYTVQKSTLIEKIAQQVIDKKLPQVVDVRDESTEDVRIVLELKSKGKAELVMAYLYKNTPLQIRFNLNMTCLIPLPEGGAGPRRISLAEALSAFADFRLEVVTRRLTHQRDQLRREIHRLEALEIIYNALDEALDLIRQSTGRKDAQTRLQERFGLDEEQARSVLELRLYRISQLEIEDVRTQLAERRGRLAEIDQLLADDHARWDLIIEELRGLRKKHGDARRTTFATADPALEFDPEAYIVDEPTWLIVSRKGRVKRQRGFSELSAIRVPDGDQVGWALKSRTRVTVTFFSQLGSAYTIRLSELPSTTGYGDPLQSIFRFEDGEKIVGVIAHDPTLLPSLSAPLPSADPPTLEGIIEPKEREGDVGPFIIAMTRSGRAHRLPLAAFSEASQKGGRRYALLTGVDEVVATLVAAGEESLSLASRRGRAMIFGASTIPLRQRASQGCIGIKLYHGDELLGFSLSADPMEGLHVYTSAGREHIIRASHNPQSKLRLTKRGGRGQELIRRGELREWSLPVQLIEAKEERA
ncbi:MAG: DNA topoisomerase (ATP-hydrolyzing) [Myxococcota bacterium]|nr:DNA topoisomerase (ATP-hydrolyzing) [Myxococcota bacterium]